MNHRHLLSFLLLLASLVFSATAQTGLQPWKKPFRPAEIVSYDSSEVVYLTPKNRQKTIAAKKLQFVRTHSGDFYPSDYAFYLTGKLLPARFESMKDSSRFVFRKSGGGKKVIRKTSLFSYTVRGEERVIFTPFIYYGDSFSVAGARSYAEGGRDAIRLYREPYGAIANTAIGLIGGYFLGIYGIALPAVYTGIETSIRPSLKGKRWIRLTNGRIQSDERYKRGFSAQVKKKKALFSGIGGAAGFIVGFGVLQYQKSKE